VLEDGGMAKILYGRAMLCKSNKRPILAGSIPPFLSATAVFFHFNASLSGDS